jgi:hypothetical protein
MLSMLPSTGAAPDTLQTNNPARQSFSLGGTPSTQPPSLWNTASALGLGAVSGPPSTTHTALSLDSMAQTTPSTGFTGLTDIHSGIPSSIVTGQPRVGIPSRTAKGREGHQRKRSRIGSDAAPFDSVDYWIDFDKEDSLPDIREGVELSRSDMKVKGRTASIPQR